MSGPRILPEGFARVVPTVRVPTPRRRRFPRGPTRRVRLSFCYQVTSGRIRFVEGKNRRDRCTPTESGANQTVPPLTAISADAAFFLFISFPQELFEQVGDVKKSGVNFDSTGRSKVRARTEI